MKEWITDFSGLANLKQQAVPIPEPVAGEVLIRINAVSLNFRDVEGKCSTACRHNCPGYPEANTLILSSMPGRL